ncbi:hypothetical protein AV530_019687 [Patagioenas fasciata monilis]|uniref:Uncharacterized protein n=1 Tax=Patagioenas fasciata monilis TaxID=372326 RepID=A0A1V4JEM2_PATFA|nr:hypothetical protein AV530_019687 [Patagioenas fasciata monilis]
MAIPSCAFSLPIFTANNYELPKNCLPVQHAQVENKYQLQDVVNKKSLPGIIIQQLTPKATGLKETEHIGDSTSQPSPWDPDLLHPILCKIVPAWYSQRSLRSRRCLSEAGGNEEWIILDYSAGYKDIRPPCVVGKGNK